jgi:hypothetical protein
MADSMTGRFDQPIPLGNMRVIGAWSLAIHCWQCHHRAVLSAPRWPDYTRCHLRRRMVCTRCVIIGADARPNWRQR